MEGSGSGKPTNSRKRKTTDDLIVEEAAEAAAATAATAVVTSSSSSLTIGTSNPSNKPKPGNSKEGGKDVEKVKTHAVKKERLKKFKIAEEYINFVGDIMYPKKTFGAYGFHPEKTRFPVERMTTLGYLLSPLRRRTVLEKWSPIEIALFEASLTLFGKAFHRVQKYVKTKTTKEVIEFYYEWKKTNHYKQWKKSYIPDEREVPTAVVD